MVNDLSKKFNKIIAELQISKTLGAIHASIILILIIIFISNIIVNIEIIWMLYSR